MSNDFKAVIAYAVTCLIVIGGTLLWRWSIHACTECGAPCTEKFNSGDPAWVCTKCRTIQDRRY